MRFDDRLSTTLKNPLPGGTEACAQYRQIIDIIGQDSSSGSGEAVAGALLRLHALRAKIDARDRLGAVQSLAGRLTSPVLVQYLAGEDPEIANAAMKAARLEDEQWLMVIPRLPVRARGMLRHRRDLSEPVKAMLARFGVTDLALPGRTVESAEEEIQSVPELPEAEPVAERAPPAARQDIGEIVQRIEAYRRNRERSASAAPAESAGRAPNFRTGTAELPFPDLQQDEIARFAIMTDANGMVSAVDKVPVGSVYGIGLAAPAMADAPGVDAAVAAAFRRRAPIRAGRIRLAGDGWQAGEWRIAADPRFDRHTGRFTGYAGIIRRPRPDEVAEGAAQHGAGPAGADGLRQILHELRTPLGAIMGFSEIIDQQLFGPVASSYRTLAGQISRDSAHLLEGFDDLDTALKLDRGSLDNDSGHSSGQWVADRLATRLRALADARSSRLSIEYAPDFAGYDISHREADRLLLRLTGALLSICAAGETLHVAMARAEGAGQSFMIARPAAIAALAEADLLATDGDGVAAGDDAPLLGLGFSLRLVRSLAMVHGGSLIVETDRLCLTLPGIAHSDRDDRAGRAE
ncbi:MAG: hypothetical protein R3E02_05095 [Blastomonas sp.]